MPFYLPRRHRRRLLLPPGLLALAGLLLLGCLALRPWQEQLTRRSVLEVNMPKRLKPTHYPNVLWVVPDPDTMRLRYKWRTFELTGNPENDQRQHRRITRQLSLILADSMHAGGVRVLLGPRAHYASMIYLLDLMNRTGVRKYWFDITRKPTAFYSIQDAYQPPDSLAILGCLFCDDVITVPPPLPLPQPFWARFDVWVTELRLYIEQPAWRLPLALLALLFLLNLRRILAGIHVARTR